MNFVIDKWIIEDKTIFEVSVVKFVGRVDLSKHVESNLAFAERFDVIVTGQQVADGIVVRSHFTADNSWADSVVVPIE